MTGYIDQDQIIDAPTEKCEICNGPGNSRPMYLIPIEGTEIGKGTSEAKLVHVMCVLKSINNHKRRKT